MSYFVENYQMTKFLLIMTFFVSEIVFSYHDKRYNCILIFYNN